jgi:hypothetical protein
MAGGGFKFLLLTFQYLVGWGLINLVISINLFCLVHVANLQCRSLAPIRYVAQAARFVCVTNLAG